MSKTKKQPILYLLFWTATAFLALMLVIIAASYFHFDTDYHFLKSKQDMLPNKLWLTAFYIHLASGIVAVLSGFPLFFERWIDTRSSAHKFLGKTYVYSIILFSGPTGFYLAFFAEGGPIASVGFLLMSLIWMVITVIAINKIMTGDLEGHQRWMIRSFCFTLSGITLRLYTPIGANVIGLDYDTNFIISAYLPWILNLLIGEGILTFRQIQLTKQINSI